MKQKQVIQSLSIIGAGNLGWHLGLAFHSAGLEIINVISRDAVKGEELADKIGAIALNSIEKVERYPDLLLIAVQDKEIPQVVEALRHTNIPLVHASGSTGIEVFGLGNFDFGVLYPLQTFTRKKEMAYSTIPLLLEGSSQAFLQKIRALAFRVSSEVMDVNSDQRLQIHLAAVFACNFTNHMVAIAERLLREEGLELDLIRPLMEQTFHKLSSMSPLSTQTGPAVRDDSATMLKHLDVMKEHVAEKKIYQLISEQIKQYRDHAYE